MEIINLLHYSTRAELRQWLEDNHNKEKCCWVVTYRYYKRCIYNFCYNNLCNYIFCTIFAKES